jgi:hypothetical protein
LLGLRSVMLAGALGFLLSTFWLLLSPVRGLQRLPEISQSATA